MRSIRIIASLLVVLAACSTDETATSDSSTSAPADAPSTPGEELDPADGTVASAPEPSAGCGSDGAGTAHTEERRDLVVDGTDRWYLLTSPEAAADEPLPLVLDFHGLMEGAQIHASMSQFTPLAQEEGFVVAFPNGTGEPLRWHAEPGETQDLAYFDAMLEQIEDELCVDTSRVYSTGLSYGAIMTSLLMCERADVLAAVAPVAGIRMPEPCEDPRPLPILTFHGTADPILTFDGTVGAGLGAILGGETPSTTVPPPVDLEGPGYPETVAAWADRNGCDEKTDTEVTPEVIHRVYDCPEGADVEFFILVGGGHSWPGSEFSASIAQIVGPTTFDVDASREAWEFFQRFST